MKTYEGVTKHTTFDLETVPLSEVPTNGLFITNAFYVTDSANVNHPLIALMSKEEEMLTHEGFVCQMIAVWFGGEERHVDKGRVAHGKDYEVVDTGVRL